MPDQCFTHLRGLTSEDVHDSRWESYLLHNFSDLESSERSITRRFEHDGIAHGQSGRYLPGQHQKREIPGDDLTYHTHWMEVGELRFHELRPTCIVVKMASYKWNIDVTCFANRFAVI